MKFIRESQILQSRLNEINYLIGKQNNENCELAFKKDEDKENVFQQKLRTVKEHEDGKNKTSAENVEKFRKEKILRESNDFKEACKKINNLVILLFFKRWQETKKNQKFLLKSIYSMYIHNWA